jgi:ABC-type multidrug transport system permease subunit
MNPLVQLTLARLREFYREPVAIFWVYGFPLLLAVILGMAFKNRPVERVSVDVMDDGTPAAGALRDTLAKDDRLKIEFHDPARCRERLRTAKTELVVVAAAGGAGYEYLLDPNRPESAHARNAADNALLRAANPSLPTPAGKALDEPGGRYIDFLVPGLIGLNLMGGGLFGVGFVTVDLRVRKLLKRFVATPMRRRDFLLALMLSRLLFTVINVVLMLVACWLMFGVKLRGDPLAFAAVAFAGGASFAGIGLMVGCRAQTLETVSGLMNALMIPMYLFSGVFFSSERFPPAIQPLIQALPLTALNNGLRAVMNDGGSWPDILTPLAILAAWGVVGFAVALRFFRWR